MEKLLLISLCLVMVIGCGGSKEEVSLQSRGQTSPLLYAPIPLDLQPHEVQPGAELTPILKDSIMTQAEQEELIQLVETLLQELAFYKREYYLQKLR